MVFLTSPLFWREREVIEKRTGKFHRSVSAHILLPPAESAPHALELHVLN